MRALITQSGSAYITVFRSKFLILSLLSIFILNSCKKDEATPEVPVVCTPDIVEVSTDILTPTVWDACHVYLITANYLGVGSTLTIQPGTVIKFQEGIYSNSIQVASSGRIIALGTASNPVVFTSLRDDAHGGDTNGDGNASIPVRKDWGGIVINNNNCEFQYCLFMYGGKGNSADESASSLEYQFFHGLLDHCTFAYCGGELAYDGYGVVDARYCENPSFQITNCTFYGCIKPLFMNPHNSIDDSNSFHNPDNPSEKNQLNGIFMTSTSNEATSNVSWLETEVPFVLTGGLALESGLNLTLTSNVVIKVATLPAIGYNRISYNDQTSSIQGYNLPGVYFTSYLDDSIGGDTNGDGNATTAGLSDWYGILDQSATISTNNYCYDWSNILHAQYP